VSTAAPISQRITQRFDRLRLLLILGVIIAHAGNDAFQLSAGFGWAAYLMQLISGIWARNNVNLLFIISGYLFFHTFQPTWQTYLGKLSRRGKSLLTPYLFWNAANLLLLLLIQLLPAASHFLSGNRTLITDYTLFNYADAFLGLNGYPAAYPFWFLRDLMLMVLLAPVFYLLAARLPWPAAAALYLYWFLSPDTVTILTPRSLIFFYLGAVWAIQRPNVHWLDRWRGWILGGYLVVSLLDMMVLAQNIYLHHTAMTLGTAALWTAADWIGKWQPLQNFLEQWASGSFFIFAVHEPLLTILRKVYYFFFTPVNDWHLIGMYGALIVLTSAGSMLAWKAAVRIVPEATRVVSGGRIS